MQDIIAWIAPAATMIAAMMTAANLGARFTGWGFVVFLVGSLAWSAIGITTGQQNLLWSNGFLTIVNIVGIWRWLGRQARYEDGSGKATKRSARAPVPSLFAMSGVIGATVSDSDGKSIGKVVECMMRCADREFAYVVVSEGGVGGVGERLHAIPHDALSFTDEGVVSKLSADELAKLPALGETWPVKL